MDAEQLPICERQRVELRAQLADNGLALLGHPAAAQLRELAERCTFFHTRVVGKFCPLDYDGILAVYRMANK